MKEPYRPSNGTEGAFFCERFCNHCIHDRNQDCDIFARSLSWNIGDDNYPKEWVCEWSEADDGFPICNPECTAFEEDKGQDAYRETRLTKEEKAAQMVLL